MKIEFVTLSEGWSNAKEVSEEMEELGVTAKEFGRLYQKKKEELMKESTPKDLCELCSGTGENSKTGKPCVVCEGNKVTDSI